MDACNMSAVKPASLDELLAVVMSEVEQTGSANAANILVSVLRRYRFWPALQVKKFFDGSNLTLLHNTYKRIDVDHFQQLYDECRSVVLDLSAPIGENVVVTFAQSIPKRLTLGQYTNGGMQSTDTCTLSYEGTVITCYCHKDKWYFGTSTCPTVDSSKYFHPTKTHGVMLDEALAKVVGAVGDLEEGGEGGNSINVRARFAERLDKSKAYSFLLVHHENKHIMDYTEEFGEGYAVLLQISARDRESLADTPDSIVEGLAAPRSFSSPEEAVAYVQSNSNSYGIFVTRPDGSVLKVSSEAIVRREEVDLGNSNVWQNLMHVYMLRIPDYHIRDYIAEYTTPDQVQSVSNSNGNVLSPTFIIHTSMKAASEMLYAAYRASTYYNIHTQRYRITRHVDESLAPIIKFHMAQLRYMQITYHTHKPLNTTAIMDYLCHHNTMKNLRLLFDHIASNPHEYPLPFDSMECIRLLNLQLKHK